MFGIGSTEIMIIMVVALLVVGPKQLPKIARTIGKVTAEFRRVSTDFQRSINTEIEREDKELREATRKLTKYKDQAEANAGKGVQKPKGETDAASTEASGESSDQAAEAAPAGQATAGGDAAKTDAEVLAESAPAADAVDVEATEVKSAAIDNATETPATDTSAAEAQAATDTPADPEAGSQSGGAA